MIESKYLARFQKLEHADMPLRGNRLLLELLPKEEIKTAGGLIVATQSDYRTNTQENQCDVAVVLATGSGYYDDDTGEDVSMDLKVGNVVLLSRYGIRAYSNFPGIKDFVAGTIALARDNDVHAAWDSIASFETYKAKIDAAKES